MSDAQSIIETLGLKPHPEGGWYAETMRLEGADGARSQGTAIYYLLEQDQQSWWHRVDAHEVWHHYAGAPLELATATGGEVTTHLLGPDISKGQRPQVIVPTGVWQSARTLGEWTLCGCTVSPGFEFSGFVLAPVDFDPATAK
jgi:predicted cupin superfamily sugar epimerase